MRRKNIKSFVLGAVLMLVVYILAVPVFGASITEKIEIMQGGIKFIVDGKEQICLDVNGKEVPPILYKGTTYLPVRAIADLFKKAVAWDGKNKIVHIGETPKDMSVAKLLDTSPFIGSSIKKINSPVKDNLSNIYNSGYLLSFDGSSLAPVRFQNTYVLNGKYTEIRGTVALSETSKNNKFSCFIKVYGDGKLLYTSRNMVEGAKPQNFTIAIKGVKELRIEAVNENQASNTINLILSGFDLYNHKLQ